MKYTQAPLPFQGQKRRFLKDFEKALQEFPSDTIYVDLFGGSGLLSHTVKQFYSTAQVICNDFDNFQQRLANIPKTNVLLTEIRSIVQELPKDKRFAETKREQIISLLEKADAEGFCRLDNALCEFAFFREICHFIRAVQKENFLQQTQAKRLQCRWVFGWG